MKLSVILPENILDVVTPCLILKYSNFIFLKIFFVGDFRPRVFEFLTKWSIRHFGFLLIGVGLIKVQNVGSNLKPILSHQGV